MTRQQWNRYRVRGKLAMKNRRTLESERDEGEEENLLFHWTHADHPIDRLVVVLWTEIGFSTLEGPYSLHREQKRTISKRAEFVLLPRTLIVFRVISKERRMNDSGHVYQDLLKTKQKSGEGNISLSGDRFWKKRIFIIHKRNVQLP